MDFLVAQLAYARGQAVIVTLMCLMHKRRDRQVERVIRQRERNFFCFRGKHQLVGHDGGQKISRALFMWYPVKMIIYRNGIYCLLVMIFTESLLHCIRYD